MTRRLAVFLILSSPAFGELTAAASAIDITPDPSKETVWIAGFGLNRKATGVHDPIMSRALVVSDGKTKLGLVALDVVGIMRPHVARIRERAGGAVDHLAVCATHNHEGPDAMGIWGPSPFVTGLDAAWMDRTIEAVAAQVKALSGGLKPATLRAAQTTGPVDGFVRDSRDPYVVDDALSAFQLAGGDGKAIATVVNWACHPETLWNRNTLLTADYPGFLCRRLEERFGGTGIFFSGALGGMMTPDHSKDEKGEKRRTFEEAERIGREVANRAADALEKAAPAADPSLSVLTREVPVPCTNRRFHVMLALKLMEREVFDEAGKPFTGKLTPKNVPWLRTETGVVCLGPVQAALVPGELFPELAVGGYDGSKAFGHPVTKKESESPPALEKAPGGPYLRDRMDAPVEMILGLANDELGYIIPAYDFKANLDTATMEPRPPGDHYEETNSLGLKTAELLTGALSEILGERSK